MYERICITVGIKKNKALKVHRHSGGLKTSRLLSAFSKTTIFRSISDWIQNAECNMNTDKNYVLKF